MFPKKSKIISKMLKYFKVCVRLKIKNVLSLFCLKVNEKANNFCKKFKRHNLRKKQQINTLEFIHSSEIVTAKSKTFLIYFKQLG